MKGCMYEKDAGKEVSRQGGILQAEEVRHQRDC